MQSALEAGAAGFVLKREIASQLLNAVEAVLAGKSYVPAGADGKIVTSNELKPKKIT